MKRRDLLKAGLAAGTATVASAPVEARDHPTSVATDRQYMTSLLAKIASPVLSAMAVGRLRKTMTLELSPTWDGRDPNVSYLECVGRLLSGMAPWLSLPDDNTPEGKLRSVYKAQAVASLGHGVDPGSPDYFLWRNESQPLVDAAFLTQALLRAPQQLWTPLDVATRARLVSEIKGLRRVSAPYTNWLLFAAMNEVFLLSVDEDWDPIRVDIAIKKMNEWYAGDGWMADGPIFHFDYYGSYVIFPMLLEILEVLLRLKPKFMDLDPAEEHAKWLKRTQRYCEHLERLISPEGTYPPIGRSLTYRTGAFQPLCLLAWRKSLPDTLPEGQVRAALTAVQRRVFADPSNFDSGGFLTLGFTGHQPNLADVYSDNGSMYLVSESFIALGLAANDSYWTSLPLDWTTKRAFANQPFLRDHFVDY